MSKPIPPYQNNISGAFQRLYQVVSDLRAPDGCPWDLEQSPATMRANLIEEAYECVEAINEGDSAHVAEELGDVFLLATMIGYMYEQEGVFRVADTLNGIAEKLVRRHPHVYGDSDASTSNEVLSQWTTIKETLEGRRKKDSVLDEVKSFLPPLERAYKIQKKAAKAGFDWTEAGDVWDKISEELSETREAWEHLSRDNPAGTADLHAHLEEELGDLLFSVINISRYLDVDPAMALHRTNAKFTRRFQHVEKRMKEQGLAMHKETFTEMDRLWDEAKEHERQGSK